MTGDDATHLIQVLKGLIPTVTPEQAFYLKREFLRFDASAVEAAIDRHARAHPAVNIPRLLEQIREAGGDAGAGPGDRDWRRQSRAEREQSESERRRIDAALGRLSDAELEREKQAVLRELAAQARRYLEKSDPHRGQVLRSLIYRRLSPGDA